MKVEQESFLRQKLCIFRAFLVDRHMSQPVTVSHGDCHFIVPTHCTQVSSSLTLSYDFPAAVSDKDVSRKPKSVFQTVPSETSGNHSQDII